MDDSQEIGIRRDTFRRLQAFSQVVEAVCEESVNAESLPTIVVDRGLEALLRDILERVAAPPSSEEPKGVEVLYQSFEQLSRTAPEVVYGFIARTIRRGSGLSEWWRRLTEESGHGGQ